MSLDTNNRERFLRLYRLGLQLLPDGGNKHPCVNWKRWQTERVPEETFRAMLDQYGDARWDILTGAISGVVSVDADSPEAVKWCEANLPETPWQTITARGRQFLYRHPGVYVKSGAGKARTGIDKLDIKGDRGIAVAPGTRHHSGFVYREARPWTVDVIKSAPVFDPKWFPERQPERSSTPSLGDRIIRTDLPPDRVRRELAKKHLDGCRGAQQGDNADGYCFALACCLVQDYALSVEDACDLLCEWGQRPDNLDAEGKWYPWTDAEIRHKVEGAASACDPDAIGSRLRDWTHHVEDAVNEKINKKESMTSIYEDLFLDTHQFFRFAAEHKVEYIVEPLLIRGGVNILSGLSFAGKTTFEGWLFGHILRGKPIFDHPTTRHDIIYYNGDSNYESLLARYLDAGFEGDRRIGWHYLKTPPNRLTADLLKLHADVVWGHVGKDKPILVAVDTLRSLLFADENARRGDDLDTIAMTKMIKPFRQLCQDCKGMLTVLFVYHNARTTNEFYGSGAFMNLLDSYWNYTRHGKDGNWTNQSTLAVRTRETTDSLELVYKNGRFIKRGEDEDVELQTCCDEIIEWARHPGPDGVSTRKAEEHFAGKIARKQVRLAYKHLADNHVIVDGHLTADSDKRYSAMQKAFNWPGAHGA